MKNKIIKSAILFSMFIAFAIFAPAAFASTSLNTGASDPANFVLGSNYTASQGCSSCWTATTSASAGQTVSVFIGYHNSGPEATQNLRIKLSPQSTSAVSTQAFTGTIYADNAGAKTAWTTININGGAQTLTYIPGSTLWYPDQNQTNPTSLPAGQTGAEIFTTGLNLGSIAPDSTCTGTNSSCHQGSIVARFKISDTTTQNTTCSITNFTATPTTVSAGGISALSWSTNGCTNVSISPAINATAPLSLTGSGSTFAVNQTTTYTLTATGVSNTATLPVTVSVNTVQPTCYITSFYPDSNTVYAGNSTIVHWSTSTGCTNVSITNIGGGLANSGSQVTGAIGGTTVYTISASGASNTAPSQSFTISVIQAAQNNCAITNAYANPSTIDYGGHTTLYWGATGTYSYITISGLSNTFYPGNNSYTTPALYANTTYTLNIYGCSGNTNSYSYPINVFVKYNPVDTTTNTTNTTNTVYISSGTGNPYMKLSITPDFENVMVGDTVNYDVVWKNISGTTLKNSTLRIKLPKEMTFKKSTVGEFSTSDNTLTDILGDIKAGENGTFKIQSEVNSTRTHKLVTTASVVFTLPSTAQNDVTAYAINNLVDSAGNSLGANALFSGFMPNSLLGWLIVILIILGIVAVSRRFYKKPVA